MPCLFVHGLLLAKPKTGLPITAYDGGIISAETLGRGQTFASNRGTPASGSENPAALAVPFTSALYTTFHLGNTSQLPQDVQLHSDPLDGKVFHYGAIGASKGVIFFEPLGRSDDPALQMNADAIGVAGASTIKKNKAGSYGISLAYLRGSLNDGRLDSGNGVRLNMGARYPTGPTMWGISIQNAPGFMWWGDHRKDTLPLKIRAGNTWRIRSGMLISVDGEVRYYDEGRKKEDYLFVGGELQVNESMFLRSGVFGDKISDSKTRHVTGGLTWIMSSGAEFSYALERYRDVDEKISRSFLSVIFPFAVDNDAEQ